jgi:hypothetical protein
MIHLLLDLTREEDVIQAAIEAVVCEVRIQIRRQVAIVERLSCVHGSPPYFTVHQEDILTQETRIAENASHPRLHL